MKGKPNKITGPSAGGRRQFPLWTLLAARVVQFTSEVIRQEFFDFFSHQ
jgi:hypothetical protein